MDWVRAIERNRAALLPIIARLVAMLGLPGGEPLARIPLALHRAVLVALRPVEAAVRRLVVIAARGLVVKLPPGRPWPKGHVIAKGGASRSTFQLFDPRKHFTGPSAIPSAGKGPRLHMVTVDPRITALWSARRQEASPAHRSNGDVSAALLQRRLRALKQALDDLPRQAKRLARWRQRRALRPNAKFHSPLRPGRPPGLHRRPVQDIDLILGECHALAFDALKPDSS